MVKEESSVPDDQPVGAAADPSPELTLPEMAELFVTWGMAIQAAVTIGEDPTWAHLRYACHQVGECHIANKASLALIKEGISPPLLYTTELTRKALEWLFGKLVIESNQRAVRNAFAAIQHRLN
jgi:hypothetical protein